MCKFIGSTELNFLILQSLFILIFFIGVVLIMSSFLKKVNDRMKVVEDKLYATEKITIELCKEVSELIKTIKT